MSMAVLALPILYSCANRDIATEKIVENPQNGDISTTAELSDAPIKLPPRAPEECAPTSKPILPEDNEAVFSEWGHITQSPQARRQDLIRIVKNDKEKGYGLWYCNGWAPEDGDFNKVSCWQLSENLFDDAATDNVLQKCGLFEKLKDNGFGLPSKWIIKLKLVKDSYPVQFPIENIGSKRFCAGAHRAFVDCLAGK